MLKLFGLFNTGGFMPHAMCYRWNAALMRLHFASDLLIGLSYVAISLALAYFVTRAKKDLPFSWIFLGFGLFIIACGATHFMEIWTLWIPVYWLSGAVKLVTAAASITVAIALPPLLPKTLLLIRAAKESEQRRRELEIANESLLRVISERASAESQTRQSAARLEELVRLRTDELAQTNRTLAEMAIAIRDSSTPAWSLDLEARITQWNPAAERLYGYCAEEALGYPASMLASVELETEPADLIARMRRGEVIASYETVKERKTGELLHLLLTLTAVRNHTGEMVGISVLATDFTARRHAEEMFRMAVEAAPNAKIMTDAAGKIVLVSAHTEKMFGYRHQELIGCDVDILIPPKYWDAHPVDRREFMAPPEAQAMGTRRGLYGVRKDGSEFPIEIGLNPIPTDQGTLVLCVVADLTDRQQAEAEIKRLQHDLENRVAERTAELIAANAELESFSYSVAHDLRAPLRQIAGFSKILAEECGTELSDNARRYLQRIQHGSKHLGTLIDDLLLLAKTSRQKLSRRSMPLGEILEPVLENLKPEWEGREIQWQVDALWTVCCDAGLVAQALVNLLSNAIKFTRFQIPARIHIGQTSVDGEKVLFVRDNGAGFDMAYASKLFGVFQRLHKPQEFEGTGVGLANVQRIVHKHGGRIWAEAQLGKGATFYLTLPEVLPQEADGRAHIFPAPDDVSSL